MVIYRSNFIGDIVSSLSWGIFSVISILILTSRVVSVFSWTRLELLTLTAVYSVIVGIFHIVSTPNFSRYAQQIHWGDFDFILLKPIDAQFLLGFRLFNYSGIIRVVLGLLLVLYLLFLQNISIVIINILLFLISTIGSYILLYSLWSLIMTATIWFTRLYNLDELMFTIMGTGRYPKEMIEEIRNFLVIFLLPITYVVTTPTKILLHRESLNDYVLLFAVGIGLFIMQRKFWKFALKYYTSASS
ncbi:ABC-2 family transporter protein [Candidatus Gottesmanbacteria bacterium]|nr:ABC-2 family transporter protein [Candidatus Gottesmanbacteria bacterium]